MTLAEPRRTRSDSASNTCRRILADASQYLQFLRMGFRCSAFPGVKYRHLISPRMPRRAFIPSIASRRPCQLCSGIMIPPITKYGSSVSDGFGGVPDSSTNRICIHTLSRHREYRRDKMLCIPLVVENKNATIPPRSDTAPRSPGPAPGPGSGSRRPPPVPPRRPCRRRAW